jgi:hypothetical protein
MSFKIDHENSSKNLKIDSAGSGIDDIKFITKRDKGKDSMYDAFYDPEPEPVDEMGLNFITNEHKRVESPEPEQDPESEQEGSSDYESNGGDPFDKEQMSDDGEPELSYEEIQDQKAFYLVQLKRLHEKGHFISRRFGMEHPLSDIKKEVLRIQKEIELDDGLSWCKQGLIFCVSTIERANNHFDPIGAKLNGWSNVVMAQQDSYDTVLEKLYMKYYSKMPMSPEIQLIFMLAGSATMFHMQKTMMDSQFANMSLPTFNGMPPQDQAQSFKQKMRGPTVNMDDLLNEDYSDVSSVVSSEPQQPMEKIVQVPKPRGRPKKNK